MRNKPATRISALWSALMVLVTACSSPTGAPQNDESTTSPPYLLPGAEISHTIRVQLKDSDAPDQIAETYGGSVLVWHDETAAGLEPFAVVVVNLVDGLKTQTAVLEWCPDARDEALPEACIEENRRSLVAGAVPDPVSGLARIDLEGRSTIWNEGDWLLDAGRSTIWNEGEFSWRPENTDLWRQLGLDLAHNPSLAWHLGAGVTVAVIDTGLDLVHPHLVTHLAPESDWLDLVDQDGEPQVEGSFGETPGYGHGTNVAGIIRQIAPEATILPIRVLAPDGRGYISDLIVAIEHALAAGADIINLSLGMSGRNEALSAVVSRATQQGVFVVMAAGNSGGEVVFPASESLEPNLPGHQLRLTVTSVNSSDERSGFAAFGFPVGLAAPGEGIWGPAPERSIAAWTGTSMAAPMASGALALALGEQARLNVPALKLVERLSSSGADLYTDANRSYEQWQQLGASRLDFWRFLDDVLDGD